MEKSIEEFEHAISALDLGIESRLLVAVSGGADSIALLDILHRESTKLHRNWMIRVAHVNHGLRGAESDADEVFVRQFCAQAGIEIDVCRVDTLGYSATTRLSVETAARELRYEALQAMLSQWPGDVIVTAHTEDDQAETLLLHLMRGSGLTGLGGMRSRTGTVIRPLLGVNRETILMYLQERKLGFRLDSSNLDTRNTRNRIRLDVLPVLRRVTPAASETLARAAALLQVDASYLDGEASRLVDISLLDSSTTEILCSRWILRVAHPALRRAALRRILSQAAGTDRDLSARIIMSIERALCSTIGSFALEQQMPRDLAVYGKEGELTVRIDKREPGMSFQAILLPVPGMIQVPAGVLTAEILDADPEEITRLQAVLGPLHALCDLRITGMQLTVRKRHAGDRMRPRGLGGSRKVQDILVDAHVDASRRDLVPVVEGKEGIVWIPGHAVDERALSASRDAPKVHLKFLPRDSD